MLQIIKKPTLVPASQVSSWRLCAGIDCAFDATKFEQRASEMLVRRWLAHIKKDQNLFNLRIQLGTFASAFPVWRMSNDELLRHLSWLFKTQRLHLHVPLRLVEYQVDKAAAAGEGAAADDSDLVRVTKSAGPAYQESVYEPPTFDSKMDPAAQAQALIAAAQSGVPFCPT